jgi:hypothetical protein
LDVSESAIHKRVQRGTLEHDKDADGRVFIYLDDVTDAVSDIVQHPSTDALIFEMHRRIESLEQQLEHEREANRENRRLLAAALERIQAIEAPQEATEPPESADRTSDTAQSPGPLPKSSRSKPRKPTLGRRRSGAGGVGCLEGSRSGTPEGRMGTWRIP